MKGFVNYFTWGVTGTASSCANGLSGPFMVFLSCRDQNDAPHKVVPTKGHSERTSQSAWLGQQQKPYTFYRCFYLY